MGRLLVLVMIVTVLTGCAQPPKTVSDVDINTLAQAITDLGSDVDADEAYRASQIAFTYSLQLAEQYNVTSPPIVHNALVNNGLRERGICVHWAEDIEARLNQEGFRTLQVHRAIAEGSELRIDHSSAIISRKGDALDQGVVLDPWRYGGLLYWSPTLLDTRYFWEPRMTVLERKYQARLIRKANPF